MLPCEANGCRKLVEELDNDNLKKHRGQHDHEEQVVAGKPFEDVDLVRLPGIHLIEKLAQDESVEDDRRVG